MGIGPLYVDRQLDASSRALATKCRPSGIKPEETYKDVMLASCYSRIARYFHITYHAYMPVHSRYPPVRSRL